ncbi:Ppx/GppA family phosphatase [Arcanobacterium phocisimile]|uniref:Ppx/GppA family phosphatase n=1 Tax=Arcanobacterium phocisimile TaxID=1302235 RepID=A0ABX7IFP8_9ACTO|nr:Ppx/GppA phosphatase family protein [Arcanobacterium phocisimile]QRV01961.1 Ppx/GppA family phosphatase [Arcanobacterium phocisimile]
MTKRVAGIDCGTNSIRLLIADVDENGKLTDIDRRLEIVRLGQGVDSTGQFDPQALERTLAVVDDYARRIRHHECESVVFAATSATRDAANRDIFIDGVRERLGVDVNVFSGDEEARTSFAGAISALIDPIEPMLAIDLGGGSTELVLGKRDGSVISAFSMDVGSVRMRERRLKSDPPTSEEIALARADIRYALDEAEYHVDLGQARAIVGLAGTVTSVAALALGLETYDSERIHGLSMSIAEIERATDWFINASGAERAAVPFLHPQRADVMGAGALVWQEVVRRIVQRCAEAEHQISAVTISEHDILDGLALKAARL